MEIKYINMNFEEGCYPISFGKHPSFDLKTTTKNSDIVSLNGYNKDNLLDSPLYYQKLQIKIERLIVFL
jgi:hypothetical protein